MLTFPDLLRRTFTDCNRAGKPLGIAVLITGGITVLLTMFLWQMALGTGVRELGRILGPEETTRLEERAWSAGSTSGMQQAVMEAVQALEVKLNTMTEEEKAAALQMAMAGFFTDVLPVLSGFAVLSFLLGLWSRSFFLVLGVRGHGNFGTLAIDAFAWMLPLLGVGALIVLAMGAWVALSVVAGFVLGMILSESAGVLVAVPLAIGGLLFVGPRLVLAPVMLLQDRTGVMESIRRSIRVTKGRWLKVFGNLLGAGAMVWIAVFAVQIVVSMLARVAQPFPPAPLVIGQVMTFVGLVGAAYQTVFLVRLKETIASAPTSSCS